MQATYVSCMFLVVLGDWKGLSIAGLGVPPPFVLGFGAGGRLFLNIKSRPCRNSCLLGVSSSLSFSVLVACAGSPPCSEQ